tara:strand:+ start:145 stop:417 length:273 start_codon:yes stop_codon:yes gene_type:complete
MKKINNTSIPLEGLVYKADLDGSVPTGSTATNVTWTAASRGYVEEVGSFNGSSSYVLVNKTITATDTFYFNATINTNEAVNTGVIVNTKI